MGGVVIKLFFPIGSELSDSELFEQLSVANKNKIMVNFNDFIINFD